MFRANSVTGGPPLMLRASSFLSFRLRDSTLHTSAWIIDRSHLLLQLRQARRRSRIRPLSYSRRRRHRMIPPSCSCTTFPRQPSSREAACYIPVLTHAGNWSSLTYVFVAYTVPAARILKRCCVHQTTLMPSLGHYHKRERCTWSTRDC